MRFLVYVYLRERERERDSLSHVNVIFLNMVLNFIFVVMEVACGEYGDMVPRLVVATKHGKAEQFQRIKKFTNCDKVQHDLKESDKLTSDGKTVEISDGTQAAGNQSNGHLVTKVNGQGAGCDTMLLSSKESDVSMVCVCLWGGL